MGFTEDVLSKASLTNLRYLFYMVTPSETTFENVEDVPNYVDLATTWMAIMLILEYLLTDKKKYPMNDTATSINSGIIILLMKVANRVMMIKIYVFAYEHFHVIELDKMAASTWFLCFVTQDFVFYLGHRSVHEGGVLWALHQMHHSSEYYNLSTAMRKAWAQEAFIFLIEMMQALVIPPNVFVAQRYFNLLYQYWLHTEVLAEMVTKLGPLEWVLNTPSSHRVHHGRNPYCIDRNYGGTLIIWDRLFGTYAEERDDEKVFYGLVDPVNSFEQYHLQAFEFKDIGYKKPQMKYKDGKPLFPTIGEKLKAIFYPPGYFPGVKTKQFFFWRYVEDHEEGIPDIKHPVKVYNPNMQMSTAYVFVQWVVFLVFTMKFAKEMGSMGWTECMFDLTFIHVSLYVFGLYFDNNPTAAMFDVLRLLVLGASLVIKGSFWPLLFCAASLYWPIFQ